MGVALFSAGREEYCADEDNQEYLGDANKMVPRLPVEDAISWRKMGKGLFIDIRDGLTIQTTGTIPALHIPRGFLNSPPMIQQIYIMPSCT